MGGLPTIEFGSRWIDKVEKEMFTVLLLPRRAHAPAEGRQFVLAMGMDATPKLFDLDVWYEDFEPAGKPTGVKFAIPARLPQ